MVSSYIDRLLRPESNEIWEGESYYGQKEMYFNML
jgi:hypothetical protein